MGGEKCIHDYNTSFKPLYTSTPPPPPRRRPRPTFGVPALAHLLRCRHHSRLSTQSTATSIYSASSLLAQRIGTTAGTNHQPRAGSMSTASANPSARTLSRRNANWASSLAVWCVPLSLTVRLPNMVH